MRTITFYSYKGGVGRSLLVANAAKYLATLGKTVYAVDLDLEAPGLHYKFELDPRVPRSPAMPGVVDILVEFTTTGVMPESLEKYTTQVHVISGSGSIRLMRAGTAPKGDYWRALSKVNWYDMFYGQEPIGVPLFLELKEQIQHDYNPDFLLIDARTGITEMGGIATTLLADTVVCLGLGTPEHLDGLRAVMQGIKQTTSRTETPVQLVAVISRLPTRGGEREELAEVLSFLNFPLSDGPGLELDEVVPLHSEPLLDSAEQLLVGGINGPHQLPLLRDYLRLFSKIIPAEDIRPNVGILIQQAISRLLDDPDTAQSELEALTTYCADQSAYRALLKVYQLRKAPMERIIETAATMWQLSGPNALPDQFIFDIVKAGYSEPRSAGYAKKHVQFADAIWRFSGMSDVTTGLAVIEAYLPERASSAVELLMDYIDLVPQPSAIMIVRLIDLLSIDSPSKALSIISRFGVVGQVPEFYVAWAKVVLILGDATLAQELLGNPTFDIGAIRAVDPATHYRFSRLGKVSGIENYLSSVVKEAAGTRDTGRLIALGRIYNEEGRMAEFEALAEEFRESVLSDTWDEVISRIRRFRSLPSRSRPTAFR